MSKPLWQHGRAVVPANGWLEWAWTDEGKQTYFIYHRSLPPVFFAAIGKSSISQEHGHEEFVIENAEGNQAMVDIYDRRPLVLQPKA